MILIWVHTFFSGRPKNPNNFSSVNNLSNCPTFFSATLNNPDGWRVRILEYSRRKEIGETTETRWETTALRRKGKQTDKGTKWASEWWMMGGRRGRTDRARPTVEAQQNDRQVRGEERDTSQGREQWKWLQREEKEMLDCLCLLCLAPMALGWLGWWAHESEAVCWKNGTKKGPVDCHEKKEEGKEAYKERRNKKQKSTNDPNDKREQIKTHH